MFKVSGSNLFGQWLNKDKIFDHFRSIYESKPSNISKIASICWSYNLIQIDEKLYIAGAYQGNDNQFIEIPIPGEFKDTPILVAGNDYNIIIVTNKSSILLYDLKTVQFKNIKFVDYTNKDETKDDLEIIKVVMTNNSCLYLTKKGEVYSGILPIHLDNSECVGKVIDIELGYEHAILVTDAGNVYTWGNGRRLQLGHGNLNNLDAPTEVKALSGIKIVKISAGGWHSCAVSEFGDLYVWGWNDTGQLGVKETTNTDAQSLGLPMLVDVYGENGEEIQLNIKDVACGSRHTAILLEDGSVWTTGSNKYGQLGLCVQNFQKVECFKKTFTCNKNCVLMCGPWSTVIH